MHHHRTLCKNGPLLAQTGSRLLLWSLMMFTMSQVLAGCVSQRADQVLVRKPGKAHYEPPTAIASTSVTHWPYAFMSAVAYESSFYETLDQDVLNQTATAVAQGNKLSPTPQAQVVGKCPDFGTTLRRLDWEYWPVGFSTPKAEEAARKHHLQVHVFAHRDGQTLEVVVAFGGTNPRNAWDWLSNLRWLIPWHDDEYTLVVKDFAGAFQDELRRRLKVQGITESEVVVKTVGHSLGGGLAQQFAYAAKQRPGDIGVAQVYAFDPSPVTGFYSVDKKIRDANRQGLQTDRAFEAYEILSYLRWITAYVVTPSAENAAIRGVRYHVLTTQDGIKSHSITDLACALYSAQ
jgi:pimeloyl-ACP methyl ester carboxylesterase